MLRRNRKENCKAARAIARDRPGLLARVDAIGERVVEAVAGIWLGIAIAALVACGAAADVGRYMTGENLVRPPTQLCRPMIGQGPYLDGDQVTVGIDSNFICNGYSGDWERPQARMQRLAKLNGPPLIPME
jgi:hypothetical protein